jgi:hypothetical protein
LAADARADDGLLLGRLPRRDNTMTCAYWFVIGGAVVAFGLIAAYVKVYQLAAWFSEVVSALAGEVGWR